MAKGDSKADKDQGPYRVLARKYRPQTFEDLIGQDAMVRILTAAFETGRIAHGFMLTGVRGVGKTTTARLIARALNYTDAKGNSTPSLNFDKPGVHCEAIQQGQHMDVLEMDAASRTGIDDIREIIDGARFKPASAAYKVYIIDEVHMLSKAAFNGLLKILEEPPEHVKFIFATTEVRKVPVTVLSRCQRFDLRRIEPDVMIDHLGAIAKKEKVKIDDGALALLARGSEGSVRDGLSLLDQAIAQGAADKAAISEESVRDMMGLADRERVLDLFDHLMSGKIDEALGELRAQYDLGADPLEVLRDLLDVTHWLTRVQATGETSQEAGLSKSQMKRGSEMAKALPMNVLSRTWQILLKGLQEAQSAPRTMAATEMVLVRLAYSADLPTPDEVIRKVSNQGQGAAAQGTNRAQPSGNGGATAQTREQPAGKTPAMTGSAAPQAALAPAQEDALPNITSFAEVLTLIIQNRDIRLQTDVEDFVHVVHFEPGRIEFRPAKGAPDDLAHRLAQSLQKWTGFRWVASVSNEAGADTVSGQKRRERTERENELKKNPLVAEAYAQFPDLKIVDIRDGGLPEFDAENAIDPNADEIDVDF